MPNNDDDDDDDDNRLDRTPITITYGSYAS